MKRLYAQNCTTRPNYIPVSLEEIEKLNGRSVVPIKYTAKDIINIAGRKMYAPINLYDAGSYMITELPNTIDEVRKLHRKFERKYNCERMHLGLNYLTPMDYYYTLKEKAA